MHKHSEVPWTCLACNQVDDGSFRPCQWGSLNSCTTFVGGGHRTTLREQPTKCISAAIHPVHYQINRKLFCILLWPGEKIDQQESGLEALSDPRPQVW